MLEIKLTDIVMIQSFNQCFGRECPSAYGARLDPGGFVDFITHSCHL